MALALLFSLSLTACQPIQPVSATQTTAMAAAEPSQEEANRAVAQRLYEEVFNQKNPSFFEEAMDFPNLANHELDFGGDGLDPVLLMTAFPDLHATVERTVAEEDMVVAQVTFTGTHQSEFLGIAPTGKPMTFPVIDIFRFQEGKIVELWHYIPVADILEQISDESTQ
jgi:predicted ester cyclase